MITLRNRVQSALISSAWAAITVVALGTVVSCNADAPPNQPPSLHTTRVPECPQGDNCAGPDYVTHRDQVTDPCAFAQELEGYSYQLADGSTVDVPSGAAQVAEMLADPGVDVEAGCQALVDEWFDNQ